ncbi:MAG TPA: PKD domain-containing protein [Steroidobacteraceae bacterium]|nr:PKD domain-containing protein [Steroidobacteraceae bacterium]
MRHFKAGLALTIVAALLAACGGGGSGSSSSSSSSSGGAANTPPTANAGPAQTVNAGIAVTLNGAASSDSDGSIASYSWTQTAGTTVALTSNSNAQPSFTAPAVSAVTIFTFSLVVTDNRGAPSTASTVDITVNPVIGGNVTFTGVVQFARANFTASFPRPLNYASPVNRPARGVLVRALNAGTQTERANTVTADDGTFALSLPANTSIDIQVVARMQRTGSPSWDVRVQDGTTGNSPFTYKPPAPFSSSVGSPQTINIPLGITSSGTAPNLAARASGPFAILDTIYTAIQGVRSVAPNTTFPALIVDWGSQADGTFFSSGPVQHIALLSDLTEDTDEFDQHVIAHEFGHYIEHNFSRADNIGGSHAIGDKIDPRVAFGEGFGYAFAAMILNDPDARDSFFGDITPSDGVDNPVHASGGFNIETNPTGSNGCWCSESSVYSILYDLYDSAADANDTVALGLQPIWDVLTTAQKNTPAFTTIFSFITALKADQAASAGAINTLVAAQNINASTIDAFATTETHFPTTVPQAAALPVYTTATVGGGPYVLRNVDDAGHYNKLGNHRFLRLTATSTRSVTITATSSNTNTPDVDFRVYRAGEVEVSGEDPSSENPESEQVSITSGRTYIIDVYDCANGCDTDQGTPGDYNLTVNIN